MRTCLLLPIRSVELEYAFHLIIQTLQQVYTNKVACVRRSSAIISYSFHTIFIHSFILTASTFQRSQQTTFTCKSPQRKE